MLCKRHLLACGDGATCRKVQPTILQLAVLPYVRSSGGVVHQTGDGHHGLTFCSVPIKRVSNLHSQSVLCKESEKYIRAMHADCQHTCMTACCRPHMRFPTCMLYDVQICTACRGASMSRVS